MDQILHLKGKIVKCYSIIENSYAWLPSYGENDIMFYNDGKDIIIEVIYDANDKSKISFLKTKYTFINCSNFTKSSFPGVNNSLYGSSCLDTEEDSPLGVLFQKNNSTLAKKWETHYRNNGWNKLRLKHYCQFFTSENVVIDIICESVTIQRDIPYEE